VFSGPVLIARGLDLELAFFLLVAWMKQNKKKLAAASRRRAGPANSFLALQGSYPKLNIAPLNNSLAERALVLPNWIIDIPCIPGLISVAAGATATSYIIQTGQIRNWINRFGATFREYVILGSVSVIRITGLTAGLGMLAVYLEESNAGVAPTAARALDSARLEIPLDNNESPSQFQVKWKLHDVAEMPFAAVATTISPVSLQFYTDNANFFTGAGTTATLNVSTVMRVCFRGLI
jgi:hypothetical protein